MFKSSILGAAAILHEVFALSNAMWLNTSKKLQISEMTSNFESPVAQMIILDSSIDLEQ